MQRCKELRGKIIVKAACMTLQTAAAACVGGRTCVALAGRLRDGVHGLHHALAALLRSALRSTYESWLHTFQRQGGAILLLRARSAGTRRQT